MLEFLAAFIGPWIDIIEGNMPLLSCALSHLDSTTADGWLHRSNFREHYIDDGIRKRESIVEIGVKRDAARKFASLLLEADVVLYSQWFPGKLNVEADSPSRDTHLSVDELTPELIARVAGHSDVAQGDTMDICLAVGTKASAGIRQTYLRKNVKCLQTSLAKFMAEEYEKEKCQVNVRTWMAINPEWTKLSTAENIEMFKTASIRIPGGWISNPSHKVIFNNAVVAIELGLLEVLQHLVGSKIVKVDEYKWNGYNTKSRHPHLLMTAMDEDEMECFKYLIEIDGTDLGSNAHREESHIALINCACDCDVDKRYLEMMMRHKSFTVNQYSQVGDKLLTPLHFIIAIVLTELEDIDDELALDKMEMLLKAGADPYLVPSTPTNQHAPPPMYCANVMLPHDSSNTFHVKTMNEIGSKDATMRNEMKQGLTFPTGVFWGI